MTRQKQPPSDQFKPLSQIVEWEDNYSTGDVAAIALSIRRFGFNQALRVWQSNQVMAGNHTSKALKRIREEGPQPDTDRAWPPENVVIVDDEWYVRYVDVSHLDAVEVKAFAIADNQTARRAVTDDLLLAQYLQEIAEHDQRNAAATGYKQIEIDRLLTRLAEEIMTPAADPGAAESAHLDELREKWAVEPGQLWVIPSKTAKGAHRLLCGDSTSLEDVTRLMNGQRAVLFATDPPYLVGYDGTNRPREPHEKKFKDWGEDYNQWDDPKQGEELYEGFIAAAVQTAITEDAAWYCWHASWHQPMLTHIWEKHGAFVHQQIIWVKDRAILSRSWYMWQHEPCVFGWCRGHKPRRMGEDYPSTVWEIPTLAPGISGDHMTSKPVELFTRPMQQHTGVGDICYEPFSGSGSQQVAGEQLGRLVYGMEINPGFCALILERLAGMGLTPVLEEAEAVA